MGIKKLIRKIILGKKADSKTYVEYLRSRGMRIGERTTFYSPDKVLIDETRPWLIEIGDDVQITYGVTMLTHGYEWSVIKRVHGEILGSAGKVKIGNNVFIGINTTILKGVTVGNNVIIGANSVINRDIPDNCVVAGNPARVVMSLEEYREKRKKQQEDEARELVREYRQVYGKDPDEQALNEFFWLFTDDPDNLPECWEEKMQLLGNREMSAKELATNLGKKYRDMRDFLSHC